MLNLLLLILSYFVVGTAILGFVYYGVKLWGRITKGD